MDLQDKAMEPALLRRKAAECRALAAAARFAEAKNIYSALALSYERLADHAEQSALRPPAHAALSEATASVR
jgi:hypothetical protein